MQYSIATVCLSGTSDKKSKLLQKQVFGELTLHDSITHDGSLVSYGNCWQITA